MHAVTQAELAKSVGIEGQQGRISKWLNGQEGISPEFRTKLREAGYTGPWPEDPSSIRDGGMVGEVPASYVTGVSPESISEAWAILHEAARAANADLMAMDVPAVGEMLGAAAEAVATGRGPEARQRAVRRAEVVLRAMGKRAP